jgi:hypothetical protein
VTACENEIVKANGLGGQEDYIEELREEIAAAEELYAAQLEAIDAGQITNPTELNEFGKEEE